MPTRFSGFPRQMPSFLRALEKNNRRDWFNPRKEIFETHVRVPMIELVTLLNDKLRTTFGVDHVADQPARLIYRIYRDTRFSRDKTPYKTHIAATFAHRRLPRHAGAGYYFEVSHRYVGIAGGVYMPGPEELTAIRSAIAADPKRFLAIAGNPKLKKLFGPLQGECLRRLPKPWQAHADSPAAEYLKFKQFYWWVELPASLALTPRLPTTLWRHFEALADGIAWFNNVILADREQLEDDARPVRPEPMW
jgi:uncharacterized protein (TIGR02453 family)